MKRLQALLLLTVFAAAPAQAATAAGSGISVGARAAYAFPFGNITGDSGLFSNKLSDSVDRMIPLWLDATLRLGGGLEVGPYFQYGFISGKSGAGDAKDWRVGGQLNYRLTPAGGLTPWLGVGAGWEWVKADTSGGDISGFDVMVQGGADFRLGSNVGIGPFVALTVGRFSSGDVFDATSVGKSWHEWLQVGAKLSFDL